VDEDPVCRKWCHTLASSAPTSISHTVRRPVRETMPAASLTEVRQDRAVKQS
jgi:hypothetical protein